MTLSRKDRLRYVVVGLAWSFPGLSFFLALALTGCSPRFFSDASNVQASAAVGFSFSNSASIQGVVNLALDAVPSVLNLNNLKTVSCQLKPGSANFALFPSQLSINPTTCEITGTPTSVLPSTVFTLTATNSSGVTLDTSITLSVGANSFSRSVCVANYGNNKITRYANSSFNNASPIQTSASHVISRGEVNPVSDEVYVSDTGTNTIWTLNRTSSGNAYPIRSLSVTVSSWNSFVDALIDVAHQELIVSEANTDYSQTGEVQIFNQTDTGTAVPKRVFTTYSADTGGFTSLSAYDAGLGRIILNNYSYGMVNYDRLSTGLVPALAKVFDYNAGTFFRTAGLAVDSIHSEYYIASQYNPGGLLAFHTTDNGDTTDNSGGTVTPIRNITQGGSTGISATGLGTLTYDTSSNRVWGLDTTTHYLLAYDRASTSGNVAYVLQVTSPPSYLTSFGRLTFDSTHSEMWLPGAVSDGGQSLVVYGGSASGAAAPLRQVYFPNINQPYGMVADPTRNQLLVVNKGTSAVLSYPISTLATALPTKIIKGASTTLNSPQGLALNNDGSKMWITNTGSNSIVVFNRTDTDNVAPSTTISGGLTQLSFPNGIVYNSVTSQFWVSNPSTSKITMYSASASGNVAPVATLSGANTLLSSPQGIAFDANNREVYIADSTAHAVYVFSATATGNVAPLRQISGGLTGLNSPNGVTYDSTTQSIVVGGTGDNIVRIFNGGFPGGNIAPAQVLSGAATNLNVPVGPALCD